MSKKTHILYDKTGAAFILDHEHNDMAYVRPMVKVILQTEGFEGSIREGEDWEPAEYLISMKRDALFDAPPVEVVDEELKAKRSELNALASETKKVIRELGTERSRVEGHLRDAQRQLDEWMKTHRVMIDLGKLLDGQVLYPLSTRENHYHKARDIPQIPEMRLLDLLVLRAGNFETGKPWTRKSGSDTYGMPFRFFNTEDERLAAIRSEFDETCEQFRKKPDFSDDIYTTTNLHYGTLKQWVRTHPALSIPDDIQAMKAMHDADLVEKRKSALVAELASISAQGGE